MSEKQDDATPAPEFTHTLLFRDPTPNGRINQRILMHMVFTIGQHADFTDAEREQFLRIMLLLGKKLVAVWTHLQRYKQTQDELVAKVSAGTPQSGRVFETEVSQELFLEFDEFLVQLKSTLDYLVYVPVPILGRKTWTLRTFGSKGEDVLNALRRNLPKNWRDHAEGIRQTVFEPRRGWLKDTITARDKVNHYLDGGISFEHFSVLRQYGGEEVRVPMWSTDQTVAEYLEVSWINLLLFVEDFVGAFLRLRLREPLGLLRLPGADPTSVRSPWLIATDDEVASVIPKEKWQPIVAPPDPPKKPK